MGLHLCWVRKQRKHTVINRTIQPIVQHFSGQGAQLHNSASFGSSYLPLNVSPPCSSSMPESHNACFAAGMWAVMLAVVPGQDQYQQRQQHKLQPSKKLPNYQYTRTGLPNSCSYSFSAALSQANTIVICQLKKPQTRGQLLKCSAQRQILPSACDCSSCLHQSVAASHSL